MATTTLTPFSPTTHTQMPPQGEKLWERQLIETEQALDRENQGTHEAEAEVKVGFFSSGSISFVDSTTTSSAIDLSPALNSVTSSVTTVASEIWDTTRDIVREGISANVELWDIVTGANERKAAQKEDPANKQKLEEANWIRQQTKERTAEISNVSLDRMRQLAAEALRISEGQMSLTQVEAIANPNITHGIGKESHPAIGINLVMDAYHSLVSQRQAALEAQEVQSASKTSSPNLTLNLNAHEGQASVVGPNTAVG